MWWNISIYDKESVYHISEGATAVAGTHMLIGYARVSTAEQNLDLQLDELKKADCEKFYTDVASGAKSQRTGLDTALEYLREGDTLVVWKLDRLGRSMKHLIDIVIDLNNRKKVEFRSLRENMDTSTPGGKLIFHIFAALAEFERDIIRERTNAGLTAARARGRKGGRPRIMDDKKIAMAKKLMENKDTPIKDICETLQISKMTLYRYLKKTEES